jgi:hypothetical protein
VGNPKRVLSEIQPVASPQQQTSWFIDKAKDVGLDFVHFNGMTGEFYYPEIFPPGVALLDYDNDGDLDVFAAQGQILGEHPLSAATYHPTGPLKSRLYRNDLEVHADGTRTLHFTDVTETSRIVVHGYAMGAAAGDVNNDGCVDLYVTNLEQSQLFRNNCDATFIDVSQQSGTVDKGWSVSASFVDYDRDGWLDLFVGNYVNFSIAANVRCFSMVGTLDYCPPRSYEAQRSHLYHNNRDGTFTDVTAAAGMAAEFGPALGVSTADFNGDGWADIYVANDSSPNQLWINQRDGTFKNTALMAGAALGSEGYAKASMGIDAGDFDNDGDEDVIITELKSQGSYFFVNDGTGLFEDRSAAAGVLGPSAPLTGFGAGWFDFDNDGLIDIFSANGAVIRHNDTPEQNDKFPFAQRNLLLRNVGDGRFQDVTLEAGQDMQKLNVGRGVAFGDIDNDGDTDVLVGVDSGPLRLLVNQVGSLKHWIGLRLVDATSKRDAVGARVKVVRSDSVTIWRRARSDGSYASANDPRVVIGLGDSPRVTKVVVEWPDGRMEERTDIQPDRYLSLQQGTGIPSNPGK